MDVRVFGVVARYTGEDALRHPVLFALVLTYPAGSARVGGIHQDDPSASALELMGELAGSLAILGPSVRTADPRVEEVARWLVREAVTISSTRGQSRDPLRPSISRPRLRAAARRSGAGGPQRPQARLTARGSVPRPRIARELTPSVRSPRSPLG